MCVLSAVPWTCCVGLDGSTAAYNCNQPDRRPTSSVVWTLPPTVRSTTRPALPERDSGREVFARTSDPPEELKHRRRQVGSCRIGAICSPSASQRIGVARCDCLVRGLQFPAAWIASSDFATRHVKSLLRPPDPQLPLRVPSPALGA